jgi:phosphatidate cytidylyltransferase
MLKQRIITAVIMLAILLPAIFYPSPVVFGVLSIFIIAAAAWEWAKLNQCAEVVSLAIGFAFPLLCAVSWYGNVFIGPLGWLWIFSGSAWVLLGTWLLIRGPNAWIAVPRSVRVLGGLIGLWVAWVAVAQARMLGLNFLFSILVLVWVADVFAYFTGKAIGGKIFRQKLAPTISPGKTWEGALGGTAGVVIVAFIWRALDARYPESAPSLYSNLASVHVGFMLLSVLFLAAMSVVGDLVESLFKRSAGVKDSSALLPGHGGVLDRIDALLPILPLSMMLSTLWRA